MFECSIVSDYGVFLGIYLQKRDVYSISISKNLIMTPCYHAPLKHMNLFYLSPFVVTGFGLKDTHALVVSIHVLFLFAG